MSGCRCGATWGGANTSHCSAASCHQTFSTVANFDKHWKGDEHRTPASVGLVLSERGYWGAPPPTPEQQAKLDALRGAA